MRPRFRLPQDVLLDHCDQMKLVFDRVDGKLVLSFELRGSIDNPLAEPHEPGPGAVLDDKPDAAAVAAELIAALQRIVQGSAGSE